MSWRFAHGNRLRFGPLGCRPVGVNSSLCLALPSPLPHVSSDAASHATDRRHGRDQPGSATDEIPCGRHSVSDFVGRSCVGEDADLESLALYQ
jgi:hypothetical protein